MNTKLLALRDKDLAALRAAFHRFPAVREVRVFGSRATGHARRASDIDLAIFAPEATPLEWADLCDALENAPIIYELDLVRAEQAISQRLKEEIEREGIVIYGGETPSGCGGS
ncbi:MAG: nucleotidyltransferase domain-containing protein [Verrucomicrobiota bacterium]|jgi:predicted nucleotidyltransferase